MFRKSWDRLSWRFSTNDPFPWIIGLTSLHPKQLQAPMEMNAHFKSLFFRRDLLDECKEIWSVIMFWMHKRGHELFSNNTGSAKCDLAPYRRT